MVNAQVTGDAPGFDLSTGCARSVPGMTTANAILRVQPYPVHKPSMFCKFGHFSAGTDFRRQNLTSEVCPRVKRASCFRPGIRHFSMKVDSINPH